MFTSILTGVIALTGVIVLLVMVLMFCEKKLVKKGKVKLLINDDPAKSPEVDIGSNLLLALSNQKIFLPSACGGKGSCALCKCQVFERRRVAAPCARRRVGGLGGVDRAH